MNALATLALGHAALVCLALAMERHQVQAVGRQLGLSATRQLRGLGWALLLASAVPAVQGWGMSVGLSLWMGTISLGAVACGLLFSYVPRQAVVSGLVLAAVGGLCCVV